MFSNLTGLAERTPQTYFLYIYALCAIPLFFVRLSIVEHMESTSHTGFYLGLLVWVVALCMVIWFYFLPDFSMMQLKKQGKVWQAEIIGDSHYAFSGFPPGYISGAGEVSEEQMRKSKLYRRLLVEFENFSGTRVSHVFTLPVDYSPSLSLKQIIETQNQSLQIDHSDTKARMPVWLNTKQKSPAFALANETGAVTRKHVILGLCLIIITLLQMILPLVYVERTTQHLTDDVFTLFNTGTAWHWAPLCNIVFLWAFHSHGAAARGPNSGIIDVIKLSGIHSTTESITWKPTSYGDDVTYYQVEVSYIDSIGQLREISFKSAVADSEEKELKSMLQQRPILYLENNKKKVLFLDNYDGKFL